MHLLGYVGYDEGKSLVERIKKKPYCVVLFDEIEKANNDVLNLLLQILEDGRLTDSKKRGIGFRQGDEEFRKEEVLNEVKKYLRPELLNRIDDVCIFNRLTKVDISKIFENKLNELTEVMEKRNVFIEVSDRLKEYIIDESNYFQYGARTIRREIEQNVEDKIVEGLIAKEIVAGDRLELDLDEEKKEVKILIKNEID